MQRSVKFDELSDDARVKSDVVADLYDVPATSLRRLELLGKIPAPIRDTRFKTWRVGDLRRALRGESIHTSGVPGDGEEGGDHA